MAEILAPGVYVQEVASGSRPISAVSTSTAAFFGIVTGKNAPLGEPVFLTNWGEFQRQFLQDAEDGSTLATAVSGFFQNGGSRLYVVNLGPDATSVTADDMALLSAIDGLSLIAAPGFTDAQSVEAILADCEERRDRFAVLDMDDAGTIPDLTRAQADGGLRPRTSDRGVAAVYTPWIAVTDPVTRSRTVCPPSGHMCGVYASVDAARGVWKAPANLPIRGVHRLSRQLSAADQAMLNPVGVNCLRLFADGIRVWGARTLADAASDWRYVPVRRLTTMIAQSLERGTRWVVFEPNDLTLWKSIRRDIGAFLYTLWREGALAGATPDEAFFVKCDAETTTQADIDAGRVIAVIGIAPVKPAEFVIIRIGQSSGQTEIEGA